MMNKLLKDIENFCAETGMSDFSIGFKSIKNGRLVERLRNGGRIWPEREKKVRAFMRSYLKQSAKAQSKKNKQKAH